MALIKNDIRRIAADLDETVDEVLDDAAEMIAGSARLRVPVDTGELRNSISIEAEEGSRWVAATAYYAHWVEFGTSKRAAHPFLVPAYEQHKDEIDRRMVAAIQRSIDRGGRF